MDVKIIMGYVLFGLGIFAWLCGKEPISLWTGGLILFTLAEDEKEKQLR